jgi:hypothetical protein
MKRISLWMILFLMPALGWGVAQAQSLSFDQSKYHADAVRALNGKAEFRFALFPPAAPARLGLSPNGFSLMPARGGSASSRLSLSPMAAGPSLPVVGGGTLGRLTKWTGFTSSNSFIGDSTIFESKAGLVGIGTDSPTSRLTVAGTIESLSGGFKFPDGTVQTTSAAGALFTVFHDSTLTCSGTVSSPLGVAIPLTLIGPADFPNAVIRATNTVLGGIGLRAEGGGTSDFGVAGPAISALGGAVGSGFSGDGLHASAGFTDNGTGGQGVVASGGNGNTGHGGDGVSATGGSIGTGDAGLGARVLGGGAVLGGNGGHGIVATGGGGRGVVNTGGHGIVATRGFGNDGATSGLAGLFNGDLEVTGNLSVTGTKNFKIDHPLDPENKYLYHATIESSEVLNVYSGNVTTNEQGEAVVTLPDWFEALNKDLRYQLTVIGTFAQAIVANEVQNNRFAIKTNAPNVKVSWQVTGVRSDAAMKKYPFKVEQEKPKPERGTYLNPEAYGQPEERGLEWVRNPELMRQMKERRIEAEQKHKPNNR